MTGFDQIFRGNGLSAACTGQKRELLWLCWVPAPFNPLHPLSPLCSWVFGSRRVLNLGALCQFVSQVLERVVSRGVSRVLERVWCLKCYSVLCLVC